MSKHARAGGMMGIVALAGMLLLMAGCQSRAPEPPAPRQANLTPRTLVPKTAGSNEQSRQIEAYARQKAQEALSQAYRKK